MKRRTLRRSFSIRHGSSSITSSDAFAAATCAGGSAAEKTNARALCLRYITVSRSAAM